MNRVILTSERQARLIAEIAKAELSDVDLERITGIARQTFWRLRNGKTSSVERPTLLSLCAVLAIRPDEMVDQGELALGLDDEFVSDAARAFTEQLSAVDPDIREEAVVEALIGMVGVLLRHGSKPSRRIYEQVIALRAGRENSRIAAA